MTGKYQSYPEYINTGIKWLGDAPSDWAVHALKRAVHGCVNGMWGDEPDGEKDLTVLRVADFDRVKFAVSDDKLTTRSIPVKDRKNRQLARGDLLIEKSGGGDKTLVGCVVKFDKDYPAVTSNFVAKMTPKSGFDSGFLTYAFAHLYAGRVNYPSIKQTTGIQNLDSDAYLMERFVFPSLTEQRTIAAFLDHETARIDRLIEKQQRLIELLKEKRQAVISHAVTKGLDPNVPMKDSGVEWLGQVPAHWEVVPLRHLTSEVTVGIVVTPAKYYTESGVPCFRSLNVGENQIKNTSWVYISPESNQMLRKSQVHPGDIIVVRSGQTGTAAVVPKEHSGSNCIDLIIIRSANLYCSEFVCFQLNSEFAKRQIAMGSDGAIQQHFNVEIAKSLRLMVPPVTEQQEIAVYLQKNNCQFDRLVVKALSQIKLLQERRTALISAAVTGKIDVRNWTPYSQSAEVDLPIAAETAAEYRV